MATLEVQDENGNWHPLLEVDAEGSVTRVFDVEHVDPGVAAAQKRIETETRLAAARVHAKERARLAQAEAEDEQVPSCPVCSALVGHSADCPRRES